MQTCGRSAPHFGYAVHAASALRKNSALPVNAVRFFGLCPFIFVL
ncbi:DedA family membrane protein [Roseibium sp. TrichSKD4]|nr:DedA family membrane protein [Roseibium sp. TrichSKD4]